MPASTPSSRFPSFSIAELVRLWVGEGDERAYAELRRRVVPILTPIAKEWCVRICHLGIRSDCPGATCDLAFPVILDDLVDRALGHPAGFSSFTRCRRGLVERWVRGGRTGAASTPLAGYLRSVVYGLGGYTEAKRAWRVSLGASARFRYGLDLTKDGIWREWEELLCRTLPPKARTAVRVVGLESQEGLELVIKALFEDSAEARSGPDEPFCPTRVARFLAGNQTPTSAYLASVAIAAELVDLLIASRAPRWAEKNLDIARRATSYPSAKWPFPDDDDGSMAG